MPQKKGNWGAANGSRIFDLPITISHALLLSYRKLVGAGVIKVRSCDNHPAYCYDNDDDDNDGDDDDDDDDDDDADELTLHCGTNWEPALQITKRYNAN